MSGVSDFLDMMPRTVPYEAVTGRDAYGAATYGAPTSYRCRFENKRVRIKSRVSGDDVISTSQVWLAATFIPTLDGRFTLPDGSQPQIVNWTLFEDEVGPHHVTVFFK